MNLMKARITKEYKNQVDLAQGTNKGAKKRKVLTRMAIKEQKNLLNIDSLYHKKLFEESTKKKKAVEKGGDKTDKEDKEEEP